MRFYDPVTQAQLTIHNVVNWINQRIGQTSFRVGRIGAEALASTVA